MLAEESLRNPGDGERPSGDGANPPMMLSAHHSAVGDNNALHSIGTRITTERLRAVEGMLRSHPAISEAACMDVPDWERGWEHNVLRAIVVPKNGTKVAKGEIIEFCKQRLPGHLVPKYVEIVDKMPSNIYAWY